MDINDLISLAKRASTPDVQYIVEITQAPGQDAQFSVRRIVEMASLETVYSNADLHGARPLEEGIARMQSEVESMGRVAQRENKHRRPIGVDPNEIVEFIRTREAMNSGEGASAREVAERFGLGVRATADHHLHKLIEAHRVRCYEDPLTFVKRYKVVKSK